MDYEKNYKDAFGLAKDWYNDTTTSEKERRLLAAMFSELKESEDERTRKEILDWMRGGTTYDWQENKEKWIAWIEKQKEQKLSEFKWEDDEKMFQLIENVIRVYGKTQGEWISGVDMDTLVVFLRRLRDNKLAEWSEEDEGMLNCIIATLCEESHGGREANNKMVTWLEKLKSLRSQPHWKPSEEQMKALCSKLPVVKGGGR